MIQVRLTPTEIDEAWTEAIYRQANAQARRAVTNNPAGPRIELLWHLRGTLCEVAVARHLGMEWTGRIGNKTDGSRHDVGDRYEVRSTVAGNLRFWPKDERHKPTTEFILCYHEDPMRPQPGPVWIVGWITIGDALQVGKLEAGRDTIAVHPDRLHHPNLLARHD